MGTLLYGSGSEAITFPDRALHHLQIVITAKLRRNESFVFSWSDGSETGGGRNTIWLSPSSQLHYRYLGSRLPALNRDWIQVLMLSANSAGGLVFSAEP
jgi:hypothetical protein